MVPTNCIIHIRKVKHIQFLHILRHAANYFAWAYCQKRRSHIKPYVNKRKVQLHQQEMNEHQEVIYLLTKTKCHTFRQSTSIYRKEYWNHKYISRHVTLVSVRLFVKACDQFPMQDRTVYLIKHNTSLTIIKHLQTTLKRSIALRF